MSNAINKISAMLQRCAGADPVFPPTDLYNEGWMLRLILDWYFNDKEHSNHLPFGNVGDLVLQEDAQHLTILEAKMFSMLSQGVTHAPYYHQAARTIACMAEVLCRANRKPDLVKSLSFFVLAPREQIDAGIFTKELERESIKHTVEHRVAEYESSKSDWFHSWFLPTLHVTEIGTKSWEELLEVVDREDPSCQSFGSPG